MSRPLVALAGNPNSGKTTLFNRLTGAHEKVGNYPGVTVERREGRLRLGEALEAVLLDVPGTYSLSARTAEEAVAIDAIAGLAGSPEPDVVVLVVDGTQLARNLYLALQVLELRLRVVLAVNMHDVLERHRMVVDTRALAAALGVPVVAVSATRGDGLEALRRAIAAAVRGGESERSRAPSDGWDERLAADVAAIEPHLPAAWHRGDEERRRALASWALMSIDEDDELLDVPAPLREAVLARRRAARAAGRDVDLALAAARYRWIDERMPRLLGPVPGTLRRVSDAIDRVLVHPALGLLLFLAIMAVVFQALFSWSAPLIDAVDGWIAAAAGAARAALPPGIVSEFLTDGVIAGTGAVLVFLPQIALLFLFIGILEDSGYMARAAFLMDRVMKAIGLTGRAFVPLLSGFACAIPAIMATRTMERHRDRMLTMMVVPLTTCSARLPVYTLVIAALFPAPHEPGGRVAGVLSLQALLMVAMYLFGTVFALLAAAVLGRTVFRGARAPLLLELPPYRMPSARSVLHQVWTRSRLFVSEAGTVILVCSVVLWALLAFPRDAAAPDASSDAAAAPPVADASGVAGAEATEGAEGAGVAGASGAGADAALRNSWGGRLGRLIEPAVAPLGFDWKIGIGLVGSFAAREVFVSTMGIVYGVGEEADEASVPLREQLRAERRPDGRPLYTPLVGLSLMVFFALAAQCMSTLAVVRRETHSWRWPAFLFAYMTALAWLVSFAVYQGGRLLGFA